MTCVEVEPLLSPYLDQELDLMHGLEIEKHMAICEECTNEFQKLERLRDVLAAANLDWSDAADLRGLRTKIAGTQRAFFWRGRTFAAVLAAASLIVMVFFRPDFLRSGSGLDQELIDNHIRSLMVEHLVDVPSSNRHTVKPWFQGKLNFAPTVPDLSDAGFVLIGGRLDVIAGRQAAAIVYKRQDHVINLWISSANGGGAGARRVRNASGFTVVRWEAGGSDYSIVSDLNEPELLMFADLILRI